MYVALNCSHKFWPESVHVIVVPFLIFLPPHLFLSSIPFPPRYFHQKWHERYFVLRSNKTLECHKSKKATEAMRSPRRIIDLRECINLEIGLEYKNLQHILSLGE